MGLDIEGYQSQDFNREGASGVLFQSKRESSRSTEEDDVKGYKN